MPITVENNGASSADNVRAVFRDGVVERNEDLSINVATFHFAIGSLYGKFIGALDEAVVDATTNFVFLDSVGALVINQTGYPIAAVHVRLARVVTAGGLICDIIDERPFLTAGEGLAGLSKAGKLIPGNFSGNPQQATVTFVTAYVDTAYVVNADTVTINDVSFVLRIENKTVNGFTIDLGTSTVANLAEVLWHTIPIGE